MASTVVVIPKLGAVFLCLQVDFHPISSPDASPAWVGVAVRGSGVQCCLVTLEVVAL
jgi:hypothetical protein